MHRLAAILEHRAVVATARGDAICLRSRACTYAGAW